jgi:phosphoribosylformylglycinamidine cyclo-ligase
MRMKYRVNIDLANRTKAGLGQFIDDKDARVLNRVGAFSSLFALDIGRYRQPVLVMKTEEPGSKQTLAFQHDRVESVCFDMINHLINDCVMLGAEPLAVQDLVVCGKMDGGIVTRIVAACAEACRLQGCALTGGETTEQPDVLPTGSYILGSSVIGIVERDSIIDGAGIRVGDVVVAVASSGPHTNGYTLIRDLLRRDPSLAEAPVDATSFLEAVLEPHRCYYQSLKDLFARRGIVGLAHITGGGIRENLNRILPKDVDAEVNLGTYQAPSVFRVIRDAGGISNDEMLRTFNLGVGLAIVCRPQAVDDVIKHLTSCGETAYVVGNVMAGTGAVKCVGSVHYRA